MSEFAYRLARIKDAGYGRVRLASNDIDPILYANEIGLDAIVVLDIRDAFREYYPAEAQMQCIAAMRLAEILLRRQEPV